MPIEDTAATGGLPELSPSPQMSGGKNPYVASGYITDKVVISPATTVGRRKLGGTLAVPQAQTSSTGQYFTSLGELSQYYPQAVSERADYFDPSTFKYMPWTIARMIASAMPNDQLKQQASYMNKVLPWIEESNGLAGVPGTLTAARMYALATHDKNTLTLLDRVQRLDPASQQMVMAAISQLRSGQLTPSSSIGEIQGVAPATEQAFAQEHDVGGGPLPQGKVTIADLLGLIMPAGVEVGGGPGTAGGPSAPNASKTIWTLSSTDAAVPVATALNELSGAHFDLGLGALDTTLTSSLGWKVAQVEKGAELGIKAFFAPFGWAVQTIQKKYDFIADQFRAEAKYQESPRVGRMALLASFLPATVSAIAGGAEKAFNGFMGAVDFAVRNTLGPALRLGGADPNGEFYKETVTLATDIAAIWATNKAMEAIKAYKVAGEYTPTAGAAELRIDKPFAETGPGNGPGFFDNRILKDPRFHPLRAVDYYLKKTIYEQFSQPIEKVLSGPIGTDFFDKVVEIGNQGRQLGYSGADLSNFVTGELSRLYGRDYTKLGSFLADARREEMPLITASYIENQGRVFTPEILDKLAEKARLEDLAREIDQKAGERNTAMSTEPVPPEQFAMPTGTADDPYLYHETQLGKLDDIAMQGLRPQPPVSDIPGITGRWEGGTAGGRNPLGARTFFANDPEAAAALVQSAGGIGGGNAWLRVKADAVSAKMGIFEGEQYVEKPISPADIEYYGADGEWHPLEDLTAKFADGSTEPGSQLATIQLDTTTTLAQVRAKISEIENDLKSQAEANPPVLRYPKVSTLRAAIHNPISPFERFVSTFFVKPLKGLRIDLERFMDELPGGTVPLWNPTLSDAPRDWVAQNAESIDNTLYRVGVPQEVRSKLIGQMTEVKTGQEFFQLRSDIASTIDRYLPKDTPASIRADLTNVHDKPIDQRTTSRFDSYTTGADGVLRPASDYVLAERDANGNLVPLPADETELMNHSFLPDTASFVESQKWWSRKIAELRAEAKGPMQTKWALKAKAEAVNTLVSTPKFILKVATMAWKGTVLVVRIPAVIERTFIEHAMRAKVMGYKAITWFPDGAYVDLPKIQAFLEGFVGKEWIDATRATHPSIDSMLQRWSELGPNQDGRLQVVGPSEYKNWDPRSQPLGVISQDLMEPTRSRPYVPESTSDIRLRQRAPGRSDFEAVANQLQRLNVSPIARTLAQLGLDVDAFMAKLPNDPYLQGIIDQLRISEDYRATGNPETDLRAFLERKVEQIRSLAGGYRAYAETPSEAPMLTGAATGETALGPPGARLVNQGVDPELLNIIATGKFNGIIGDATVQGAGRFGDLLQEVAAIDARLKELVPTINGPDATPEDFATYRALQDARKYALTQMEPLRAEMGPEAAAAFEDQVTQLGRAPGKNEAMVRILQQKWEDGTWEFPNEIYKKQGGFFDRNNIGDSLENIRAGITNMTYRPFRVASAIDLMGARGSMYRQAAERAYQGFLDAGYSEVDARAFAELTGARQVRDLMYRLGARTSFQRSIRDIFWFEPVAESILSSWLVKAPRQFGMFGYGLLPLKAAEYVRLFQDLGVIKQDSQGKWIIPDPLMTLFSTALSGHPQIAYRYATSIQPHWATPWPTVSTLPAVAIHKIIGRNKGILSYLADKLAPSDVPTVSVPASINYLIESATGKPVPWEFLSPQYQQLAWDRSFDQAIQAVYQQDYLDKGISPPRPEQFADKKDPTTGLMTLSAAAQKKYRDAVAAFTSGLLSEAERVARANAFVHFAASTFTPGNVTITTKERSDFYDFLNKNVFTSNNSDVTQMQLTLMKQYVAEHPESLAYSYFTSYATGQKQQLLRDPNGDFTTQFLEGARHQMTPDEYVRLVQTNTSYAYYQAQLDRQLRTVSPTLDLTTILTSGGKVSPIRLKISEEWNTYKDLTPQVAQDLKDKQLRYAELGYTKAPSLEAQRMTDLLHNFELVAPVFTGEGGVTSTEYQAIRGQLAGIVAEIYAQEKSPSGNVSPLEAGTAYFYRNIMDPYMQETQPIWNQIADANVRGEDTTALYAQLTEINRRYDTMDRTYQYNGRTITLPTPEQVFYGNKSTQGQLQARLNWETKPLNWLSPFQLDTIGVANFPGRTELADKMTALQQQFASEEKALGVVPGSSQWDAWKQLEQGQYIALGAQYGAAGQRFVQLSMGTALDRMNALGVGAGDAAWSKVSQMAQTVSTILTAQGLSARGTTGTALVYKEWLYRQVESYRDPTSPYYDPAFDRLMSSIGESIPLKGYPAREGVPLYEALFFNNWQSDNINPMLIQAVAA